jgi:hypothetical protein
MIESITQETRDELIRLIGELMTQQEIDIERGYYHSVAKEAIVHQIMDVLDRLTVKDDQ